MATRKGSMTPVPKQQTALLMQKDEAALKLTERLIKGQRLLDQPIHNAAAAAQIESEYDKWDAYNRDLLLQMFTSDERAKEYLRSGRVEMHFQDVAGPHQELNAFIALVADKRRCLESIIERLDLTPVDRSVHVTSTGPIAAQLHVTNSVEEGYAFIAMPIDPEDHQLVDVLDAIKEGAKRCGIRAERVDEEHSNERITDRMLESIRRAEYVIADVSNERPNVFYEAGYALGIGKTPIYLARYGTKFHFDIKDYPTIVYRSMKELKDGLEARLRGLEAKKST